jgi:hypothetical protein
VVQKPDPTTPLRSRAGSQCELDRFARSSQAIFLSQDRAELSCVDGDVRNADGALDGARQGVWSHLAAGWSRYGHAELLEMGGPEKLVSEMWNDDRGDAGLKGRLRGACAPMMDDGRAARKDQGVRAVRYL